MLLYHSRAQYVIQMHECCSIFANPGIDKCVCVADDSSKIDKELYFFDYYWFSIAYIDFNGLCHVLLDVETYMR